MKSNYQITVPEPCKEDWEAMQPNGKGRFCDSCQHSLRDFSNMNDNELLNFFLSNKIQCGHFTSDQLDRNLIPDRRNLLPTVNLRAIAMGFGILISTSAFASGNALHSAPISLIETLQHNKTLSCIDNTIETDALCQFVVVNSEGKYVAGVHLELLDERGNVADVIVTDKNGMATYNRMLIKEMRIREIRVIAKSKKYERIVIPFQGADSTDPEVIRLDTQLTRKEQRRLDKAKSLHYIGCPAF